MNEFLEAGRRLLGNRVRFNHWPEGSGKMCTGIDRDGMVEIEGLPGYFAPHLFTIDGDVRAVPLEGEVN